MLKLFSILLITPFSMFGQEKVNFSLTKIGLSISPEVNSLITGSTVGKEQSKSKIGISMAVNLEFVLTPKTIFRSGLGYGTKSYDHTHSELKFASDIQMGTMSKIESKISYSELQLPFMFQFKLKDSKFFISTGIELTYPISYDYERIIYLGNGEIDTLASSTKKILNFAPQLSLGYKLPVSAKLNVSIEAMIKYYMKGYIITESTLVSYGLRMNVMINY